jgi:deoxyribose-phosphate aldolase
MENKESMKKELTVYDIAQMIDHSLLRPNLTEEEFTEGVELSMKFKVATCSVVPYDVKRTVDLLKESHVPVSTVIGFPHGTSTTEAKVFEARRAVEDGAIELDMVMAIGRHLSGSHDYVREDIAAVVDYAHAHQAAVKVIIETCYLNRDQIVKACQLVEAAGADFVKTSTGYGTAGATLENIKLMRASCSSKVKVKAAGGIRTLDEVLAYRAAGTDRLATRATAQILAEAQQRQAAGKLIEL